MRHIFKAILLGIMATCSASANGQALRVSDAFRPLGDGQVQLTNYFQADILNSIEHWNKGVVPYRKLMDFYVKGAPVFALGEMWAKAVRSGSMLYGYTHDAALKSILEQTVEEVFGVVRSNGTIRAS